MKIAIIVERFPPDVGGSGTRYYKIAEHLSKKHTIDVFTLGNLPDNDEECRFNIYTFNLDMSVLFSSLNKLNRVLCFGAATFLQFLFRSYDVIDVDIWPFLPFFAVKAAKPKTPVVVSWNVVWPFSYNKAVSKICEALAYPVSKVGNYHVTVSNFAKDIMQRKFRIPADKITVIPNGVDKEFVEAKLEPQPGRIIYVGRLEPQKRLDLIIEAFKLFKKKVDDAELHIIGSGPLYTQLKETAKRINGVHLHRQVPPKNRRELANQLKKSWVFISASEFESYGLSIAESLSTGLPALLTNAPYNAVANELVRDGYNGIIVEHNKPEAIAAELEKLYRDQKLWDELSKNAKRSMRFSWDEVARKVEKIYKKFEKSEPH
ncbi:MAG: glycosyltransferase family 4 protein [Candidatus Bathyarchaeales archaeon]